MKIGIVLPQAEAYSETFFANKIKGLRDYGHDVILFVGSGSSATNCTSKIPIKVAPKLSGNFLNVFIKSLSLMVNLFLISFKSCWKLYQLNRNGGFSIIQTIKNILSSSHMLNESLD